ncbi:MULTISPECIES: preprotein translocase subunit SecY [unclassified Butyrivibrio]|uniref:preprotein translocase subunit SecY n=1 Tax=unclassified Butyrivibrio TaxID=2639466 RepID=UPI0003B5F873|nr:MULTISPECIES: preprotein translocase subunit SecY [unclassified Butyrivibrio]SDB60674.1 protein translocase subunit secY/sec61 alpha [Butyrivibrio sp. INlla16]SEM51307.1 protein translocase subunit secY/sec61 alpha [Butyrivibrio sp. ob235]
MFTTIKNAFKIKDIRLKLLFTFAMLLVIRLGSAIPVPGMNVSVFQQWFAELSENNAFGFMDRFTGGSFENMSILALNITPYITSSIIIQLLTIAIPKFEEWQRDGEDGRKKLAALTRYITVALALIESVAMAIGFYRSGFLIEKSPLYVVEIVAALTAGSAFLMWIGERITDNGVGNGISIVLTINIISRMPSDLSSLFTQFVTGKNIARGVVSVIIIVAVIVAMVVLVVLLNGAERRIPVQYAKKIQGRKTYGGNHSEIPLKVNTAGVMPIIFAMSLFQFPIIISQLVGYKGTGAWSEILKYLNQSYWCNTSNLKYSIGLVVYVLLLIFFAYFYTSITFNPLEIADNMKKQGGFIPGIRPGKPTSDYLTNILNYIIFIGAVGLTIIGVLPIFFNGVFGANVSFGGTSLIIVVSVILETVKQIESQMLVRNYKGFLDD